MVGCTGVTRRGCTPTAALVIEVRSPGDETYDKFGLYAKRGVEELLVADPQRRAVQIWLLRGDGYTEAGAKPAPGRQCR